VSRTRIEFTPTSALGSVTDQRGIGSAEARLTTTEEQHREAVRHALEWMVEHRVWVVEVRVEWTRYPASVLTVKGHAEHLHVPGQGEQIVPDWDEVTEADLEGVPIIRSPSEEQARLERELAEVYRTTTGL
jgi:hypothetical protein